jgi:hypothetical protein
LRPLDLTAGQEFNQLVSNLPTWTGWLATLVASEDGLLVGPDGNSKGIGNDLDLQLLLALRSKADVIFTTGKTARAERYRSSRFAPIAFMTKSKASLKDVPAVDKTAHHENIYLTPPTHSSPFEWASSELLQREHHAVLFEGGPSSLKDLWLSKVPCQLVFSVANCNHAAELDVPKVLSIALPWLTSIDLVDDMIIGPNRVTRWVKSAN